MTVWTDWWHFLNLVANHFQKVHSDDWYFQATNLNLKNIQTFKKPPINNMFIKHYYRHNLNWKLQIIIKQANTIILNANSLKKLIKKFLNKTFYLIKNNKSCMLAS